MTKAGSDVSDSEKIEGPRLLLNARDAAKALAISERKLWDLTNQKVIRSIRIGRAVRYLVSDLQDFVERCCEL